MKPSLHSYQCVYHLKNFILNSKYLFIFTHVKSQVDDLGQWEALLHIMILGSRLFHLVVVQSPSCQTLCDPMDCSMLGFPVLHHLLEFAQTHIHCVGDAIQTSHPLLPSSPPALNLSQHQVLFK